MLVKCVRHVLDTHRICVTDIFVLDPSFYTVVPGADHLMPSSAKGTNVWSCTSAVSYVLMA